MVVVPLLGKTLEVELSPGMVWCGIFIPRIVLVEENYLLNSVVHMLEIQGLQLDYQKRDD